MIDMSYRVRVSYVTHSGNEGVRDVEVTAPNAAAALKLASDLVVGRRGVKRVYTCQVVGQPIPIRETSE